jgi:hypothetical protein
MNGEGPVADFELQQLRSESYAKGWSIFRTQDGNVTACREDGTASVTVGSVPVMRVVLHNEMWKSFTERNPGLPEPGSSSQPDD